MKIKNVKDLREHAAQTLELLDKGKIDTIQAACNAKLYESMVSSLKAELEYNRMLQRNPNIDFLENDSLPKMKELKKLKKDK